MDVYHRLDRRFPGLLTSMHPRKPETFVLKYSCFGSKLKKQPKTYQHSFEALFVEGSIREISSFGMASTEGDYMLVDHKHKNNFYKTTKVHVSNDFTVMRGISTLVLHWVVSMNPIKVIIENSRAKRLMNLVDQDLNM
uniref:Uncharacterized protein n=1 Tax=Lactuca sativa TaxID=4236 RepID=A0A9R1WBH7_LACSA|nr:hypothetical protein LSAT_V11C200065030 [Lactuca sativa]